MNDSSHFDTLTNAGIRPAPPDLTGQVLGDYQLIRRLGRGGMADVYLAEQKSLGRYVALKLLRPELARDAAYVQRFQREARAAAALNQANIVQIYEVGQIAGHHFIAQEYVRGQNLRQYITRHGAVEPVLAVGILSQVAAALKKAAHHGVIHRDIKPENIMLAYNGEVKVTDFGLARVLDEKRVDLTQVGITMGTPMYMSPEQIEGRAVDPRSDIYSLGVTGYHMLAGRPPFEAETALALAVQHVKQAPQPLHQSRPDLPIKLCNLIERMMAKRPEDRVQDASELLKQLRDIPIDQHYDWNQLLATLAVPTDGVEAYGGVATVASQQATIRLQALMSGRTQSWWRRPSTWWVVTICAIVGVAGGAAAAFSRPPPDPLEITFEEGNRIPRQATARDQYRYAYWVRSEQAWKAVAEYFPPHDDVVDEQGNVISARSTNQWFSRLADERLGEHYLRENDLERALQAYTRLANVEDTELRFNIVGRAGKALVYDQMGDQDQANRLLFEIEPHLNLLPPTMRTEIEHLLQKNRLPGLLPHRR